MNFSEKALLKTTQIILKDNIKNMNSQLVELLKAYLSSGKTPDSTTHLKANLEVIIEVYNKEKSK